MGIGIRPHARRPVLPEVRLTTPHGDRDLVRRGASIGIIPQLTTPHGDRDHLGCGCLNRVRVHPHYPSWGSGSAGPIGVQPDAVADLTTPHGDRDLLAKHRCRSALGLTTPHGDRDPGNSNASTSGQSTHYPSWGSGSPVPEGTTTTVTIYLTTPHGDRDLETSRTNLLTLPLGSLPLMGIGIPRQRSPELICDKCLTTPHGDRDRVHIPQPSPRQTYLTTPHGDRDPFGVRSKVCGEP